jgi:hypothetical protein
VDLSVLNFERFKWGGVRHLYPVYVALDLELFARGEKLVPQAEDLLIWARLLEAIRGMETDARLDQLQKALGKHLDSSKDERGVLIQILGYCGVLQDPAHPGFLHGFRGYHARPSGRSDWHYPVAHWRGRHRVNEEALAFWFGDYQVAGSLESPAGTPGP